MDFLTQLTQMVELQQILRVVAFVVTMLICLYAVAHLSARLLQRNGNPHAALLVRKALFYFGSGVIIITILLELGFDLRGLLATAGIASVAIGFAAQTSLSNLISGLFLVGEKPFQVGDLIRVDGNLGLVDSIDLLSTKIRTLDNLYIRIPNEQLIKSPVTTITRYPIRRMDILLGVAYHSNIGKVMEVLKAVADANKHVLKDPEPLILFDNFGANALEFRFGVWFEKRNYLVVRNSLLQALKERFDAEGIEIPFPQRTLHTGGGPLPVKIVDPDGGQPVPPEFED